MQKIKQYKLDYFFFQGTMREHHRHGTFRIQTGHLFDERNGTPRCEVGPQGVLTMNDERCQCTECLVGFPVFGDVIFLLKGGQRSRSYDIYHGKEHTCKFFRCDVLGCFVHCYWLSGCTFCWLPLCTAGRLFKCNKLQNDIQIPSQKTRIIQIEHAKTQNEYGT